MPTDPYRSPIPPRLWNAVLDEFGLPALGDVRQRIQAECPDPDSVLRRIVRVFTDEGTFCPVFQFLPDILLNPVIVGLFQRAVQLRISHNYFTLWTMTPCHALDGARPVDRHQEQHQSALTTALESTLARAITKIRE